LKTQISPFALSTCRRSGEREIEAVPRNFERTAARIVDVYRAVIETFDHYEVNEVHVRDDRQRERPQPLRPNERSTIASAARPHSIVCC
jgi:hypothetical protein